MPYIITDLKFSKRSQVWVHVYLDHQYEFTLTVLDAAALSTGQALEAEYVSLMKRRQDIRAAYSCAIRYLSHRQRSRKEIDRYLDIRRGFARETISAAIARLTNDGYLDDKEFARLFVESRVRSHPRSRAFLSHELSQKGIDDDVIDAVLEGVDDERLAWRSIESKMNQWATLDRARFKKRLISFLQRRGFSLSVALNAYHCAVSQNYRGD
jgi:regulatory protein